MRRKNSSHFIGCDLVHWYKTNELYLGLGTILSSSEALIRVPLYSCPLVVQVTNVARHDQRLLSLLTSPANPGDFGPSYSSKHADSKIRLRPNLRRMLGSVIEIVG